LLAAAAQMEFVPDVNDMNGLVDGVGEEYGLVDFGDCFAAIAANGLDALYAANPDAFGAAAAGADVGADSFSST